MPSLLGSPSISNSIPLPAELQDCIRIIWHLSHWCNYSCQYCQVLVFRQRSPEGERQAHSFDHHSVEEWLEAIRRFPQRNIHLKITGGEPFLDRKNFRAVLAGLAEMKHIRVGIDTNGYWDPGWYDGIDKSGIWLNVSYHPSQTDFEGFFKRLLAIRDSGFTVTMVNYIVAPENMDSFEAAFTRLDREGFVVNASVMIQTGLYLSRKERTEHELDVLVRHNTPLDLYYKLLQPRTKGRLCFYPAMTVNIRYDGWIRVSCMDRYQDLFKDGIPDLSRTAVPCPHEQCDTCVDMYRALTDEPRYDKPVKLYTLEDYSREFSDFRCDGRVDDPEVRREAVAYWSGQVEARRKREEAVLPVLKSAPVEQAPTDRVFGFVDSREGKFYIQAHSKDRVWVSGWAASGPNGTPLRELRLKIEGQEIAVLRDFFPRPDVAEYFARADLLHSGWQALVFLPALRPGTYELIVEATDREGLQGTLPPWRVEIVP